MVNGTAKIIVGASPVAADRRHVYVLFERSDGSQTVVRGGPDARAEGNDLANLAQSTLLGTDRFGKIVVDAAPYVAPYQAVYQRQADGTVIPLPADQVNTGDPALLRNAQGAPIIRLQTAPDWPFPGEEHERRAVWSGSDRELDAKLAATLNAAQQINAAKLEYSPLYNNSNGVASTLLTSAGVAPQLPLARNGEPVSAPNFGEDLYQEVGVASHRSGYRFDGHRWYDTESREIQPPTAGDPLIHLKPAPGPAPGSFDSSSMPQQEQPVGSRDMRDVLHPDNARYQQAYAGVTEIDRILGRAPDQHSERLAAALAVQSKDDGLDAIHHVVLSRDGTRAFAVDTVDMSAPWAKRSSVDIVASIQQTTIESSERLDRVNSLIASQQVELPSQDIVQRTGPAMS